MRVLKSREEGKRSDERIGEETKGEGIKIEGGGEDKNGQG